MNGYDPMPHEVQEALELAAGGRIPTGGYNDDRRTANRRDITITRRTILLFLESLSPEMTVAELREHLDQ